MQSVPYVPVESPTVVIETHRGSSRTTAYVDIVLTVLRLGFSVFVGLNLYQQDGENQSDFSTYLLVILGVLFFLYLINLVLAYGLLQATELTTPLNESLRKTQRWFTFNAALFILELISVNILGIIIRSVLLCTVNRYLNELKLRSQGVAINTVNGSNTQGQATTTATAPAPLPNTFNINLNNTVQPNLQPVEAKRPIPQFQHNPPQFQEPSAPCQSASFELDPRFQNSSVSNPGYPNYPPPYSG